MLLKHLLLLSRPLNFPNKSDMVFRQFRTLGKLSLDLRANSYSLTTTQRFYTQFSKSSSSESKSPSSATSTSANLSMPSITTKNKGVKLENSKNTTQSPVSKFLQLPVDESATFLSSNTEWRTVYRFSHIRTARVVQRFKLYQTAFTCLFAVPTAMGCFLYGVADSSLVAVTSVACGLACSMLYIMGNFFSRLIGIIYVTDEDPDIVRVAHMTFWGNRKDDIFTKTDFIPFSELSDNTGDVYIQIKTYSDPEHKLYLSLKYGEIHDQSELENIFGKF